MWIRYAPTLRVERRRELDARGEDGAMQPSFALRRPGHAPRVRFAGSPLGHEFPSLVLALLQAGGGGQGAGAVAVEVEAGGHHGQHP